jgi:hypothetical protein
MRAATDNLLPEDLVPYSRLFNVFNLVKTNFKLRAPTPQLPTTKQTFVDFHYLLALRKYKDALSLFYDRTVNDSQTG